MGGTSRDVMVAVVVVGGGGGDGGGRDIPCFRRARLIKATGESLQVLGGLTCRVDWQEEWQAAGRTGC